MKKEYLILAVLIFSLSAYLVLKKDNQQNYTLPAPVKIEKGKIDKIVVTKKNIELELAKEDEIWVVTDKKFTADMKAVNDMHDAARNLKISALISENQDINRYELDDDHLIDVKAFKGKDILVSFKIGKKAPSANHTFIMLAGDTRIYQADKSFKKDFDTTVDMIRDKQVLIFKKASIKQITLEKGEISKTMTTVKVTDGEEKLPVSWEYGDKTLPDKEALADLLSSLSFLTCERFSALSKEELGKAPPLVKILLENDSSIVLNIFELDDGDSKLVGTSSMSQYPFILASYISEDILSYVDKLMGLVKEEKKVE